MRDKCAQCENEIEYDAPGVYFCSDRCQRHWYLIQSMRKNTTKEEEE